jgi:hypothetical protein
MIQKQKKLIIEVIISFYMACLANRCGKNTCVFLQKVADLESKIEWFLALKQDHFAGQNRVCQKTKAAIIMTDDLRIDID